MEEKNSTFSNAMKIHCDIINRKGISITESNDAIISLHIQEINISNSHNDMVYLCH